MLSAITASPIGNNGVHRRPVAMGAGIGFFATIITWFIAVGIVSNLSQSIPALDLEAFLVIGSYYAARGQTFTSRQNRPDAAIG